MIDKKLHPIANALRTFWTQLRCRHEWRPVHHSYECTRCNKYSKD